MILFCYFDQLNANNWASQVAQWLRIHLQGRGRRFDPWIRKTPWRRKWQPTPVFLPGKSMDRGAWQATVRSGVTELDTTEQLKNKNIYI